MSNTQTTQQFKIGDRVRFKKEHLYYADLHRIPLEFVVGVVEDLGHENGALFRPNEYITSSYGFRLELVPEQPIQTQQKEKTVKNKTQTKQKLGKTQLKQDYAWALVDKCDGFVYGTYLSRSEARWNKTEFDTIKKVKLEVIGRG